MNLAAVPTTPPSTPEALLAFLAERGGREYRLTVRGESVQATGPSGQSRLLSPEEFLAVFGHHEFTPAQPTGVLTDLGPLFS